MKYSRVAIAACLGGTALTFAAPVNTALHNADSSDKSITPSNTTINEQSSLVRRATPSEGRRTPPHQDSGPPSPAAPSRGATPPPLPEPAQSPPSHAAPSREATPPPAQLVARICIHKTIECYLRHDGSTETRSRDSYSILVPDRSNAPWMRESGGQSPGQRTNSAPNMGGHPHSHHQGSQSPGGPVNSAPDRDGQSPNHRRWLDEHEDEELSTRSESQPGFQDDPTYRIAARDFELEKLE